MKSNIVSIALIDNCEFVAGKSWNGGGYSFRKVADGECKEPELFKSAGFTNIEGVALSNTLSV